MLLLFDKCGAEIQLTEEMMKGAIKDTQGGKAKVAILVDDRAAKVQITEEILKAAIENTNQGKEIVAILVNKCGCEIQLTDELERAAVENNYQGRQMIVFLLDRCESRMLVTEQIIKDPATKVLSRKAECEKHSSYIGFTGPLQAQLEDSKELLELLLDRRAAEM